MQRVHLTTRIVSFVLLTAALLALGGSDTAAAKERPARPTPTPVSDPLPALNACATDIFGVSQTYTKSGGLTKTIARTLKVPTQNNGTVSAMVNGTGTAVYGLAGSGALTAVVYGSGTGSTADVSIAVSTASLCYVQVTSTAAPPTSADAALTLLKTAFPGAPQNAPYLTTQTKNGYIFTIVSTRPVKGSAATTKQAVALAVVKTRNSLVLSATSALGTYVKS